jgi:hypothetical protein
VEVDQRGPPAVQRLLQQAALGGGAARQRDHAVVAVLDVERLFPADFLHGAGIGLVAAIEPQPFRRRRDQEDRPRQEAVASRTTRSASGKLQGSTGSPTRRQVSADGPEVSMEREL